MMRALAVADEVIVWGGNDLTSASQRFVHRHVMTLIDLVLMYLSRFLHSPATLLHFFIDPTP